jgi:hypothetical protein
MIQQKYRVHAATRDAIDRGYVWVQPPVGVNYPQRAVCKIKNFETGRSAYCELLQADRNYLRYRHGFRSASRIQPQQPAISLNQWYREKLGIPRTGVDVDLGIFVTECRCKGALWRVRACLEHPEIVVRLATVLSIVGVILGCIGIGLGVISLF